VEKLLYTLWHHPDQSADEFRDAMLQQLGPQLAVVDAIHCARLAVADSAVDEASARRIQSHSPAPAAILSLWVDFAGAAPNWEPAIEAFTVSHSAYRVLEAEPLVSSRSHPSLPGERVYGMCQVAFLRKPAALDRAEWLALWQGSHTPIAIETQSTFGYRQNLVIEARGEGSLPVDAIVEEHFPPQAMASDDAFYDTGGDQALLQQRMAAMLESCARFIDFNHIDVIPMSEYLIKPFAAP